MFHIVYEMKKKQMDVAREKQQMDMNAANDGGAVCRIVILNFVILKRFRIKMQTLCTRRHTKHPSTRRLARAP
jgi:hypothetical protein